MGGDVVQILFALLALNIGTFIGVGGVLYRLGAISSTQDDHERRITKLEVKYHGQT